MERTDTFNSHTALLLPILDGQSDANAVKGSVGPGTVASRIRSLNELERKAAGPAVHRVEDNASPEEKSVLRRAPRAIREVDRSLQSTPQRPSPFVRRSGERRPTSPPTVPSAHSPLFVHAPVPKFTLQRPTFLDVSPESSTTTHVAGQWQKPRALQSPIGADRASYPTKNSAYGPETRDGAPKVQQPTFGTHGRPVQFETLSSGKVSSQGIGKNADNKLHLPRKQVGSANPWGVTLRKSQPALNTRPPYNSIPHRSPSPLAQEDITIENTLRTSRPISPSIGKAPRKKSYGRAGERSRPTTRDISGSASGDESNSEAPVPVTGLAEKTDRVQAADVLEVSTGKIGDTTKRLIDPPGTEPHLCKTLPQSQVPVEGSSGPVTGQQQLDGGRLLTFDIHIKKQADKLNEVIQQLKFCGPWLEEIRTSAQEQHSRTTYMESLPDESPGLHHSIPTWSSASKSDSRRSWELYEVPQRIRKISLPNALIAPDDAAETVDAIVKDDQPTAASGVSRAQSHHDTAENTLSLPDSMEVSTDPGSPALMDPVQPFAEVTPRAHSVDINPAASLNPYWFSSPSAITRFTLTPPPGRTMGEAMSHKALCKILPLPIYPQDPQRPQREQRPADHRGRGVRLKSSARYDPSSSRQGIYSGYGPFKSPGSGSSLSNKSSISQCSFKPTPALYFSYQQIPPSLNPTASDPTLASSYREPVVVIPTTAQQGHCFAPPSSTDRGTPSSGSRDSPPPPPPGFMGYDPAGASAATKNRVRRKQRAQSEAGEPPLSDMSFLETHPPLCESRGLMETSQCESSTDHENTPCVEALSPVQDKSPEFVPPVANYTSQSSTSQSADPAGVKQNSAALALSQANSHSSTCTNAPENPIDVRTEHHDSNDDTHPRSAAAESGNPLNTSSGEQNQDNSDPTTVIHVDENAEGSKQNPDAGSKPVSSSPPSASSKSSLEAPDDQPPSEAKATEAPTSSTDHSSPRRPLPLPVQWRELEQQEKQHEALRRSSEEQRRQTHKRVEQWCRSLPGLRFTSATGQITVFEQPSGPPPSSTMTADSSLPPSQTQNQHLDVRTRVRLLEAARRVKEMELKEARAAATAAAAVEAGTMELKADESVGDDENAAIVGADDDVAGGLFKGDVREQIGSLEKPFW
ncbi:uncharacterized protein J3D65DRAFT_602730 [Phyllosticta citribraziliensis]|uniref:Uncharacterized protein n=1 Tax=Phyllosticta citribraziliensis TaxID=989973 RepID=A0ABR1LU78_9PEZI